MYCCWSCGLRTAHPVVVRESICPRCDGEFYMNHWEDIYHPEDYTSGERAAFGMPEAIA